VVYIGESVCVEQRIRQHVADKTLSEIREVFFFTSKDDNLTKGHIAHLEQQLLKRAGVAKRYTIANDQLPADKPLSKPELATMEEFLENLLLVSAAMGYDVFSTPPRKPGGPEGGVLTFNLKTNRIVATGYLADAGFVVCNGSGASLHDTTSLGNGYKGLRAQLRERGVLAQDSSAKALKFVQDYTFKSASAAACVVAGSQRNGLDSWCNADGQTLGEIQRKSVRSPEAPSVSRE
jgi:hypothetical protein